MRKIKLKVKVKPKCNCEDHYLELCTSFDGETFTYQRYCYKCGKWWIYTKHESLKDSVYDICFTSMDSTKIEVHIPRTIETENLMIFYNGYDRYDVCEKMKDGSVGKRIMTW